MLNASPSLRKVVSKVAGGAGANRPGPCGPVERVVPPLGGAEDDGDDEGGVQCALSRSSHKTVPPFRTPNTLSQYKITRDDTRRH
jgi:hypothetical protein